MNYTWSYSSISLFQQCPKKYYRLRVAKDIVEPPRDYLLYGSAVHKAAEDYVRDGTPIPEKYAFVQQRIDPFVSIEGEKLCEYEMGLTKNMEPCGFRDKNVWFRGIADLLIVNKDKARIVDWKTGKSSQYADKKQLELLSLLVFKHFPQVKSIKAALVFLVAKDLVPSAYTEDFQYDAWQRWLPELDRLEAAYTTSVWNAKPNFTCRNFCAVTDCEHNGRK
jgi:hypothetical protein